MNPALSSPVDELVFDPSYSTLKQYLTEATGFAYYADKDSDLIRRIRRRWDVSGMTNCGAYLQLLQGPQGALELDALVAEITIGESYFFRHSDHFTALRELVLPDILQRNAQTRRLRIWCAGCSDGAEPYSLSILLRRELADRLAGWNVTILGTDINRQYLAKAREARFEEWALRTTSEEIRRSCFTKEGKQWCLVPEYKKDVTFQFHNLVSTAAPSLDPSAFDLIVCRNVMIYFGPDHMTEIVQRFQRSLVPEGWLIVGPSEPNMTSFTSFHVVNAPGVTLYQNGAGPIPAPLAFPRPAGPEPIPLPVVFAEEPDFEPELVSQPAGTVAELRRLAGLGLWSDALRCGDALLKTAHMDPLVHFYLALALERTGNLPESERALRRAIYLDRHLIPAHYHLGLVLRLAGEALPAIRCFRNTLQLLDSRNQTDVVVASEDLTVTQLRELAAAQLAALEDSHENQLG